MPPGCILLQLCCLIYKVAQQRNRPPRQSRWLIGVDGLPFPAVISFYQEPSVNPKECLVGEILGILWPFSATLCWHWPFLPEHQAALAADIILTLELASVALAPHHPSFLLL